MNARKLWAIALSKGKELTHYFSSFMGYVVLFAFFAIGGFFYYLIMVQTRQASMRQVFQNLNVILLFVITPMITMRLWSEEEKNGTAELLRTSPITIWEIVLGKYLAVCAFFGVMLSSTVVYLDHHDAGHGNPDHGPGDRELAMGYILAAMAFFAIGLFASTLSENQIVSAVITYGILLMLWVIGAAGSNAQGVLGELLKYVSIFEHLEDFFKGVIDLSHVFYFASIIFLGLFFSVKVMESKRS